MKLKKAKPEKKVFVWNPDLLAQLLVALYICFFSGLEILKYNSFSFDDFDLAVHAQTLYNILHGSIQSSILGVPFLGNHLNFILFLIIPIYAIFRSALTLLLLQTIALGLSAYPIYLIAKEELPKRFSLLLLFSYLFYPCLGYVNLYEFHPTVFATFFLSAALYFIYKNRFWPFISFVILTLLCQENMPLLIVPLGVYLFVTRKHFKWWLAAIIIGAAWFWIGAYKIIPYFGKGTIKFIAIYGHLGNTMSEVIKNILLNPMQVIRIILLKANLVYLSQIFGPVLFLPLLSPISCLSAFPTIFQHILSLRETEHTIYYHYTAEIIPFIFFASVFALKKILSLKIVDKKENFLSIGFLAVTLIANGMLGPHINSFLTLGKFYKTDLDYVKEAFLEQIPKKAEVVATFEFLPKLSARERLYSLHHAVMGKYTLSDMPYELPKTTEYAVVDFEDWLTFKGNFYGQKSGANLRQLFADGNFSILNVVESIALCKKGVSGNYYLYKILQDEPPLVNKLSAVANSEIELISCRIDKSEARNGIVSFRFYWRGIKKMENIYGAFIDIVDSENRLRRRAVRFICYRVYPTNEWVEGQVIEEYYRMLLPPGFESDGYQIKMGIFDFYTQRGQEVVSTISGVVDPEMRINLTDILR